MQTKFTARVSAVVVPSRAAPLPRLADDFWSSWIIGWHLLGSVDDGRLLWLRGLRHGDMTLRCYQLLSHKLLLLPLELGFIGKQ